MAYLKGEASAISVQQPVQQNPDQGTQLAHDYSPTELHQPATSREDWTANEERQDPRCAPKRSGSKWAAFDRLLRVSLGLISPAYLFNSFPPD
jgi:hypothetical protein